MSDVNSNINVNIDTSEALANIKNLQRQISLFHQEMARSGSAANQASARSLQNTLMNNINATGQFRSQIKTIQSETEHFTEQLERNKMSVGQYFRYAGAATKSFGKLWKSEFNTIEKVAVERVKTLQTQYIKLGRDANGALKSIAVRPLALDMNNFATKAAIAAQKQQLLNQLLKQGSTAMLNWGKNTQWAGRQLMVGFTIPLAMAGTAAAKAYIEFEKAAIKFKRVYGDFNTASADVDKMANSIKGLAQEYTKYGVAVADTMNMAADAAAMGKTGADLLAQVSQSARLAVLGNVDQAQSLETLTSLTNTFGIAADKLATNIDFLNAVENQTVTSIEDLTEAIPKAAPVIQQLGGDVKDLTYFLTAMKEGGINASEGANAIKSGLASIINPTKAATDMLNGYGISITAIRDAHADDVSGMVQDLAVQLDKLAPMDRARAIETLFGKFQFARMSTMFQNIARDGSQANKVLETAKMSTEELAVLSERELKKIEQSPAFKFEKALKDIQAKLIPVGEAFLKAVTPIVEWVGKILDSFNNMGDGAKQFLTMATIAVAGIGPVALMTFGLIANGVANLIKMFAGIKSFFNNTSGGTKTLGDTTEYMTQKELEAQAVASSLEQSHAKLTQQFTVQASAIRNLTEEYERAIGAQTRMLGGMSQMGVAKGTPGFSTGGTVEGPSGNDNLTIKATAGEEMLTQGQVTKGSAIMGSIIDRLPESFAADLDKPGARRRKSLRGNIESLDEQGFGSEALDAIKQVDALGGTANQASQILRNLADAAKGGPEAVKGWMASLSESAAKVSSASGLIELQKQTTGAGRSKVSSNFTHVGSGVEMSLQDAMDRGLLEGTGNEASAQKAMDKYNASGKKGSAPKFSVKSMFGMDNFDAKVNREMAAKGASSKDFLSAFDSAGVDKWNTSIKAGGGNIDELNADLKMFDARIKEIIASSNAEKVFDSQAQAAAYGPGATSVESAVAQARAEASPQLKAAIDRAASTARETRVAGSIVTMKKGADQSKFTGSLQGQFAEEMGTTPEEMKQIGKDAAAGLIEGTRGPDGLDSHSPSRKMHQVGMDGANGLINGAKEGFAKIPGAPIPGVPATPATGKGIPGAPIPGVPMPPAVPETAKTGFVAKMKGVGSDIASKGLGALATGIEKGKDKVINVAGTALNNYMQAGYRQADAERELSAQRMGLASDILMATDAEYAAMQKAQDAHQKQLRETNQATQEEIDSAVQRSQAMARKREAIAKDIENSKEDLDVIKQRLANAQQADVANDLEAANAQQDGATVRQEIIGNAADAKKEARRARNAKLQRGLGGATMAVGAVSAAASQLPGQYGAGLGGAGGAISAGLGVASMLPGPWGLALGAIVALGTAAFAVNEAMNKARQEAYDFARAMGTGKDAIQKFADFTGRATATEIMDKKRLAKTSMFEIQPGKRSFGQSYFESEAGKALKTTASSGISKIGSEATATQMANQLSTAVGSGALTAKEARSIAGQLGTELGDQSFGINVVAQMNSLIGPDGENLTNGNALEVRVNMIDAGQDTLKKQTVDVSKNVMNSMNQAYKDWDWVGNITGGSKGIGIQSMFVGGIVPQIAAITTYFTSMGTQMGALQAGYQNQMEMEQQLLDSMDLEYQGKIEALKTQGKINEALELQRKYESDRAELVAKQGETVTANMDAYDQAGWVGQGNLGNSVNDAIKAKFKDQGMDAQVQQVIDTLTNADIDNRTEYGIKSAVSAGQMGLNQATLASTMFANNDANANLQGADLEKMMGSEGMGVEATNQALGLAQLIKNPEQQAEFMVRFKNLNPEEAQPILDAMEEVKKTGKVFDAEAIVNFYATNPKVLTDVKEDLDNLKDASKKKTKITVEMVSKEVNPETAASIRRDLEYFNGLDKDQQIIYTQTVDTLMQMHLNKDKEFEENYNTWLASGNKGNEQDYINYLARQETVLGTDITETKAKDTGGGGGGGGGPEAHWTDDYVKKLRNFSMASQKLTTGINASTKALKNFKKAGQASFNGLSQQLRAAGASEAMISHILEDDAKNIKKFFKNGKLTAAGLKVQARMFQATIAEAVDKYRSAAKVSADQATAMRKLTNAGMSYVGASEMIQDTTLAQAIANAKNKAEIDKLIETYKKQQVEMWKINEMTAEGRATNDITLAEAHIASLEATSEKYQNALDIIASKEEDINKTYNKRMEALDKVLQVNQQIADSQKDQLSMADALSKGDIFAAAKAMADQKAKDAQKQAEAQKQALTDARDAQVKGLTATINGKQMNREDLETRIKDINDEILQIKRDEIVAQNELIKAKEYEAKLDIDKAARNAPKKEDDAKKGGTPKGGSGGGGNGGGGPSKKDPAKPATVPEAKKSQLDKYKDTAKNLNKEFKRLSGLLTEADKKIAAANKKIQSAQQMGSAGTGMLAAAQKELKGAKEAKSRVGGAIAGVRGQRTALVNKARNSEGWLAAMSADDVARILGVNFKKDGKSPQRKGLMKHPFARGKDMIPSMIALDEFVVQGSAVRKYGMDTMLKLNAGMLDMNKGGRPSGPANMAHKSFSPVYNINIDVAKADASADEIASAVIKYIDRSNKSVVRGLDGK